LGPLPWLPFCEANDTLSYYSVVENNRWDINELSEFKESILFLIAAT